MPCSSLTYLFRLTVSVHCSSYNVTCLKGADSSTQKSKVWGSHSRDAEDAVTHPRRIGMWYFVIWRVAVDVSKGFSAIIFRVHQIIPDWPGQWRHQGTSKRQKLLVRRHGVTFQKIWIISALTFFKKKHHF